MKLEIKKFKISGYLKAVMTANLIILGFLVMTVYASKAEMEMPFNTYNDVSLFIGIFVRATFTIFASVLISRLIIGEYKSKTINVLFTYPINRKKIMLAKLVIVVLFTFITMIISNLFLNFSLLILNLFLNFIQDSLTMDILVKNLINIVVYSGAFAFVSLIPVFVGMKKKSGSATIVTAIILVSLLNSGNKGYTLSSIIIIPLILAIIGAAVSYLSIKDVEKVDVVNF
jgi:ABC-type transport system involved in multi-copper enzyme maturation permease subunit